MIRGKRALLGPIAAIAILASLAYAGPAGAEQIAYSCGEDICLINPDNPSEATNLTETHASAGHEQFPVFSPDGKLIAFRGLFVSGGFETWNIYTLDPAEPAPREATDVSQSDDRGADFDAPAWSPDGTRLAWSSTASSSANPVQTGIYAGSAAGTSLPIQIGAREGSFPTWSADGTTIAFGGAPESVYIGAANAPGASTYLPGSAGLEPVWSPDGKLIATHRWNSYPYKMRINRADGSGGYELTKPGDLGTAIDWSSDSTRIVYVGDEEPIDRVWVAPADGSSPGHPIPMPKGWIVPHNPSFNSDGTRVVFTARQNTGPGYEQILVAPADGSAEAVAITSSAMQNEQPSWKPGPGSGPKPPAGGAPPATQQPVKLKLSLYKNPRLVGGGYQRMLLAGVDCHAPGGHPTGWVAEFCAANASAYPQGSAPAAGFRPWAKPKAKPPLFAKGKVRVPEGKTKPLVLKITAAGRKLLKPGKKIKLKVTLTTKRSGAKKATTVTKTVTLKVPAKK
ncbi:MAG TPA: hypothetical protein VFB52_09795 [Solirubrobacterales bacterium]|nr:hypothetical protein [Solirubrobacterales bacterium]